jgi:hypothetical protein
MFYVLMVVGVLQTNKKQPVISDIVTIRVMDITDNTIQKALDLVEPIYKNLGQNDKVAKGKQLLANIALQI